MASLYQEVKRMYCTTCCMKNSEHNEAGVKAADEHIAYWEGKLRQYGDGLSCLPLSSEQKMRIREGMDVIKRLIDVTRNKREHLREVMESLRKA